MYIFVVYSEKKLFNSPNEYRSMIVVVVCCVFRGSIRLPNVIISCTAPACRRKFLLHNFPIATENTDVCMRASRMGDRCMCDKRKKRFSHSYTRTNVNGTIEYIQHQMLGGEQWSEGSTELTDAHAFFGHC